MARTRTIAMACSAAFGILFFAGCAKEPPPRTSQAVTTGYVVRTMRITSTVPVQPAPEPPPVATAEPTPTPPAPVQASTPLSLDDACGISESSLRDARFASASARLTPGAVSIADKLATCIKEGKLKDQKLTLVGKTDSKGSVDFNERLGQKRAEALKSALVERGVPAEQLTTQSVGESEATGTDASSRAKDRFVDVRLTNESR